MSLKARTLTILVSLFAATSLAARGDTFTYSAYGPANDGFTVTSPTLINAFTVFQSNVSCSVFGYSSCLSVTLDPVKGFATWYALSQYPGEIVNEGFVIPPADFLAPGTYSLPNGGGPFSITDTPSSVTPEPSSLVLFATGAFGLAEAMRRRYCEA